MATATAGGEESAETGGGGREAASAARGEQDGSENLEKNLMVVEKTGLAKIKQDDTAASLSRTTTGS